jgi:hypothetical protein
MRSQHSGVADKTPVTGSLYGFSGITSSSSATVLRYNSAAGNFPVHVGRDFPVMVRAERTREFRLHRLRRSEADVQSVCCRDSASYLS